LLRLRGRHAARLLAARLEQSLDRLVDRDVEDADVEDL
jgi:hypothetical protein